MQMRVRLLKLHACHPIGAVLVLPREEAARLHRLGVCICLAEVPDEATTVLPGKLVYSADVRDMKDGEVRQLQGEFVPDEPAPTPAPPVSVSRGRGRRTKR